MIPLEDALRALDDACAGVTVPAERVGLAEAHGRIVREHAASRLELPPFDKSAVDGWAIRREEASSPPPDGFTIAGAVHAGMAPPEPLLPGTTVKVMTGAPVPGGTGRVIMVEQAEERDGRMRPRALDGAENICHQGENLRPGDIVVETGSRLSAVDIGNLASAGLTHVDVARRVKVAILSTGDELVRRPEDIAPGKILDSNGPMLAALAVEHELTVASASWVADDPAWLRTVLGRVLDDADIVIATGGVSEGDSDHVAPVLRDLGLRIRFDRIAVKPGKPTTFAHGSGRFVLGLPGNPVSACLMFHLFALRLARRLAGARDVEPRSWPAPLASACRRRQGSRLEFVPARIGPGGLLETSRYHGSGDLAALGRADGFFRVPVDTLEIAAGEPAIFHPILRRWSA